MTLTIQSKSPKRPWVAQIKGVGWYEAKPEAGAWHVEDYERIPVRKLGFKLAWSGAGINKVHGQTHTYAVEFNGDGVFQVKVPGEGYKFFGNKSDGWWEMVNPFPRDWSRYMKVNHCSYEDVWQDVWDSLCAEYERHNFERDWWTAEEIEDFMEGGAND